MLRALSLAPTPSYDQPQRDMTRYVVCHAWQSYAKQLSKRSSPNSTFADLYCSRILLPFLLPSLETLKLSHPPPPISIPLPPSLSRNPQLSHTPPPISIPLPPYSAWAVLYALTDCFPSVRSHSLAVTMPGNPLQPTQVAPAHAHPSSAHTQSRCRRFCLQHVNEGNNPTTKLGGVDLRMATVAEKLKLAGTRVPLTLSIRCTCNPPHYRRRSRLAMPRTDVLPLAQHVLRTSLPPLLVPGC